MKNSLKLFLLIFTIYFLGFGAASVSAQKMKLEPHKSYFQSRDSNIVSWIQGSGMSQIIQFREAKVKNDLLFVWFKLVDLHNWKELSEHTLKITGTPLDQLLFYKMQFQYEVPPSQIMLKFDGKDGIVTIRWSKKGIVQILEKKQGIIPDKLELPIGAYVGLSFSSEIEKQKNLKKLKGKLEENLKAYFKSYETMFEKYKFVSYSPSENELFIEVRNITNAILEEGYFEKIQIVFNFKLMPETLTIDYMIQAKYGAGLIWAPYDSRYKDMEPKYADQLKKFGYILKHRIGQTLEESK